MSTSLKITSALISVFDKEGLAPIVQELNKQGVTLYSTGGTEKFIRDLGIDVVAVEDITSYPSILGGRVKTLHPKVFGGILNRQNNTSDQEELAQFEIPQLDLVIVDLYPFEKTVASGAGEQDIIENGDNIKVRLGPELTILMRDFCKIHAEKPENVLKSAARDYIRRETIEGMSVTKLLQRRMNELSARFNDDSNAQR